MKDLGGLSDRELLAGVQATMGHERRWVARVIAYLAEIDRRKLYTEAACSSLFDFCLRRLGMSEGEAFRRMTAARLVQEFPAVLDVLDRGDVHLTALVMLRDHLTKDNHVHLLREASGKTKQEVAEMIAARAPKPDVPSRIVEIPSGAPAQGALGLVADMPERTSAANPKPEPHARIEPLAPARYRVELTASKELRDKLTHAQDLMRHRNPSGDLSVVLDKALDLLIAKLEKERLGKTTRPREPNDAPAAAGTDPPNGPKRPKGSKGPKGAERPKRPGYIRRSVRRAVYERDGHQCTFVDAEGRRCPCRAFLELDHIVSKALGGSDEVENLRVRCRAHNRMHAEQVFGREHVERQIHLRQQKHVAATRAAATEHVATEHAAVEHVATEHVAAEHVAAEHVAARASAKPAAERVAVAEPSSERISVAEPSSARNQRSGFAERAVAERGGADAELTFETAARGLRNLGFRDGEVRRALAIVRAKLGSSPSAEAIVREALRVLT